MVHWASEKIPMWSPQTGCCHHREATEGSTEPSVGPPGPSPGAMTLRCWEHLPQVNPEPWTCAWSCGTPPRQRLAGLMLRVLGQAPAPGLRRALLGYLVSGQCQEPLRAAKATVAAVCRVPMVMCAHLHPRLVSCSVPTQQWGELALALTTNLSLTCLNLMAIELLDKDAELLYKALRHPQCPLQKLA